MDRELKIHLPTLSRSIFSESQPMHTSLQSTVLFLLFLSLFSGNTAYANPEVDRCHSQLKPIQKKVEFVDQAGGVWGLFEKFKTLRSQSTQGLQLDKVLKKLLHNLDYLCATLHGVPLNELATFVTGKIHAIGKTQFRNEMILLGKPPQEVDSWLIFAEFALQAEHRSLNPESVQRSILHAETYFNRYKKLAQEIDQAPLSKQGETAGLLFKEVQAFFKTDANVKRAVFENSRVPYWDIDENYGGS